MTHGDLSGVRVQFYWKYLGVMIKEWGTVVENHGSYLKVEYDNCSLRDGSYLGKCRTDVKIKNILQLIS